ncbi:SDR family NAD(P)-dependent oxidoreductase [Stagnimonas aquatica]|uniref:SDR family NAD(P)-dependent oxidoreductase n=1 Tax=Stagnimonas aquatica TaxID=2689987 RepID=A0A3N0VHG3_9GAMM|nr:SDR family NAD(P)-dependent oxidoreductase [Stagnimonas aquatica]ROH92100.1 SDR family NAD(P)-dependent oxidoreductase [Stagnimonas aquatica]
MAAAQTLAGRVALVTGASRGIGRAIALRLSAHGAAVALAASPRSQAALEGVREAILAHGGRAAVLAADLADETARAGLVAQAEAALGPVDILINNAAGISAYAPPSKIDLAARRAMFELNLQAPIDLIQQALPGMRVRRWGRIVNLSSDTSAAPAIPYAGDARFVHALALYGASKAALDRYSTGLAAELHGSGVQVNALLPYKIARSESAEQIARQTAATRPDWVEPLELMAEAAYLLVAGAHQGEIAVSRALLQRCQQPLHALDGETVIGDARSLVEFS